MGKPTHNSAVLASFVAYCKANPSQRFWQALYNWSGVPYVLVSNAPAYEVNADIRVGRRFGSDGNSHVEDPYYWEGKNS